METAKKDMEKLFGSMVFRDPVLESKDANKIADAMKNWAIEKGATYFAHWFQPLTGITAAKSESFISKDDDGRMIIKLSGKELSQGEPDAASFPSGGLRSTCNARGYTIWDPTSYAFVKGDILYIPAVFCSHNGEALDKKLPLLRSMDAINKQALRVLRLFGDTVTKRVIPTVGAEQEYFLVDKNLYNKRLDLVLTGRTLFGAMPPKGQELEEHYYGEKKSRVNSFMEDLCRELWKLGVYARTRHNEVAPAQFELAPIFMDSNIAVEQNHIIMELINATAEKYGLAALLHEKPFLGVNGSGKHNNWSIGTDLGRNLLGPSDEPHKNTQFLLFLAAVIKAVDEYQDILRASVANAGNDHRTIGANEAPPAIISIFLGTELTDILEAISTGREYQPQKRSVLELGVSALPEVIKDSIDRNRTSPFAFTGNKFEFRMCGSQFSVAEPNIVLNTIVAEALCGFADCLEKSKDIAGDVLAIIKETFIKHKRIVFNGDNYSAEWKADAVRRGLSNLATTVDAAPAFISKKSIELFDKHHVLTEKELHARLAVQMERYCKTIKIEALTLISIARREILPVCPESKELIQKLAVLENIHIGTAADCRDKVLPAMLELRSVINRLEASTASKDWPLPTYSELLFF